MAPPWRQQRASKAWQPPQHGLEVRMASGKCRALRDADGDVAIAIVVGHLSTTTASGHMLGCFGAISPWAGYK